VLEAQGLFEATKGGCMMIGKCDMCTKSVTYVVTPLCDLMHDPGEAGWPPEKLRLYEFIVRSFLACCSKDAIGWVLTRSLVTQLPCQPHLPAGMVCLGHSRLACSHFHGLIHASTLLMIPPSFPN
jgi:hypothetical protein